MKKETSKLAWYKSTMDGKLLNCRRVIEVKQYMDYKGIFIITLSQGKEVCLWHKDMDTLAEKGILYTNQYEDGHCYRKVFTLR